MASKIFIMVWHWRFFFVSIVYARESFYSNVIWLDVWVCKWLMEPFISCRLFPYFFFSFFLHRVEINIGFWVQRGFFSIIISSVFCSTSTKNFGLSQNFSIFDNISEKENSIIMNENALLSQEVYNKRW